MPSQRGPCPRVAWAALVVRHCGRVRPDGLRCVTGQGPVPPPRRPTPPPVSLDETPHPPIEPTSECENSGSHAGRSPDQPAHVPLARLRPGDPTPSSRHAYREKEPPMRTRHRTAALGAALAAAAMMLSACGGATGAAESGSEQAGEPQTGGTLVYLDKGAYDTLYPPEAGFYPNGGLVNNITDRLVYQNPETLEFEPWLATDWEVNDDATEYTFTLREDVTFSDGSPLNAKVVAANFDLYGLGDSDRALIVSEAVNNYDHSEVIDPHTVKFYFSDPAPGFLQATSTINSGILSLETIQGAYEDFGPGNATSIVGTGPFVVEDEEIGASITLKAREDYDWAPESTSHRGRAYVDEIQVKVTPEASVRVGALLSGQAGIARSIPAQDEERVSQSGVDLYAAQTKGVNNSWSLRIGNDSLSDIRVRQALFAGID